MKYPKYNSHRLPKFLYSTKVAVFLIIALIAIPTGIYLSGQKVDINPFATNANTVQLPITSTFVMANLGKDPAAYIEMLNEMRDQNIDTIIVNIGWVTKNCTTGKWSDYSLLKIANRAETILIREALKQNFSLYFSPRGQYWSPCIDNTAAADRAHLLEQTTAVMTDLKTFLQNEGVDWKSDSRIAGSYIPEETETYLFTNEHAAQNLPFYADLSKTLHQALNNKPVMTSPWQSDRTNYDLSLEAYKNLISQTTIDIIAPQDSLGTGKTTTTQISGEHFRALADAKKSFPDKKIEVWANIETFVMQPPAGYKDPPNLRPSDHFPAPISRIKAQIEAAAPYVSKMTNWIYQFTMLSTPKSKSAYSLSKISTYNPSHYDLRKKLRVDYLNAFAKKPAACIPLYYIETSTGECQTTTTTYHPTTLMQCDSSISCVQNLASYLPGKTTETCYKDQSTCISTAKNTCRPLFYYNTQNKKCIATSSYYNPTSKIDCGGSNTCETNLSLYHSGKTTGVCHPSLSACQSASQ